jgi:hypothetical protein
MADSDAHSWWTERLRAALADAKAAGIAQDVSVAVITDVINGPVFSPGAVVAEEGWNQDIGEPEYMVNENQPISAEGTEPGPGTIVQPLTRSRGFVD